MSYCYKSDLRCASLSAFESALFCFFFGQAKKKSPKASEATNEAVGPNADKQLGITSALCAFCAFYAFYAFYAFELAVASCTPLVPFVPLN